MPQIKVSFDIDANGILNVTARDQGTGKEQTVTITESTNLDKSEADRMVREAEQYAAQDQAQKERVQSRNQADSLAYQLEQTLQNLSAKVPANERARCDQLIAEARKAVQEEGTSKENYDRLAGDLQQALHMVSSVAYQQAGPSTGEGQQAGPQTGTYGGDKDRSDEDVIDAEFTEE